MAPKTLGLFPALRAHRCAGREGWYYTLMMSTGLTFWTISAEPWRDRATAYSYLVATVMGSTVRLTMIPNAFFMPSRLLPPTLLFETAASLADGAT